MTSLQTDTFRLDEIEPNGNERFFLLTVNGRPYKVGELVYMILEGLVRQRSHQEIVRQLNARPQGPAFSEQDLQQIIDERLKPLGVFGTAAAPPSAVGTSLGGIYWRHRLLSIEQYEWLLRGLKVAFGPAVFFPVFVLALAANIFLMRELLGLDHYVTNFQAQAAAAGDCLRGLRYVLLFYPIILATLLIHELGHAAASYRFGVRPKEIGFGLYLIFPVLYTDVTEIWRLGKLKRTIVNLGGLYFQLLINLGLIYWLYRSFGDMEMVSTARYLIQLNVAMMVINAVPFLKFDGYWIYSDLFSLPNLRQQSSAYLMRLFTLLIPGKATQTSSVRLDQYPLLVYSVGRLLFLVYFFYWAFAAFFGVVAAYPAQLLALFTTPTVCTLEPFLKASLTVGLFAYFSVGYSRSIRSGIRQYAARRKPALPHENN